MRFPTLKTSFLTFSILLVVGGLGTMVILQFSYRYHLSNPVDKISTARVVFTVEKGETGKEIAKNLAELSLIPSSWAFTKYLKEQGTGNKLEAGKFILKKSFTIPEIAEVLLEGKNMEIILTIREGLSLEQVDQYLTEEQFFPNGTFLDCARTCHIEERFSFLDSKPKDQSLEGYLFADTYYIDPETITPKSLILRMLKNFDEKLSSELRSEIAKRGSSIHQIVTMASMIEKEALTKKEKPIISGILWKRFKEKMMLGVDATTRYALQKWTGPLTTTDLNTDSPFNTRKILGLPPGPIGNFSLDSFRAAIEPKESPYYYYLHDQDGNIHYAKTLKEHVDNKARYLD